MSAIHDQFTHQMRRRLKTTGMGLGLVQLLQDAGLITQSRIAVDPATALARSTKPTNPAAAANV